MHMKHRRAQNHLTAIDKELAKDERTRCDVGTPFGCATVDYPGAEESKMPIGHQAQEGGPEGKARDTKSIGPDVNLVGIGSETQSRYLRTGRAADLGYVHTHHRKP